MVAKRKTIDSEMKPWSDGWLSLSLWTYKLYVVRWCKYDIKLVTVTLKQQIATTEKLFWRARAKSMASELIIDRMFLFYCFCKFSLGLFSLVWASWVISVFISSHFWLWAIQLMISFLISHYTWSNIPGCCLHSR